LAKQSRRSEAQRSLAQPSTAKQSRQADSQELACLDAQNRVLAVERSPFSEIVSVVAEENEEQK
jgi:hypothetical protein